VARLGRPGGLSAAGKQELWERWRAGESISDIARALQKPPGSIHGMLQATGGFSPPELHRRRSALTPSEREEISRGLAAGESLRAIAARLGRSASTVCREVNRNGGRRTYRAQKADERAWERARRPKRCLLGTNHFLRDVVARKLQEDWSPEQISGWLKREYPDDETIRISHETIYRTLFVQARGALKRELLAHLRSRRMMRKGRHASTTGQPRGQIKEAVSIRERPPEAEDRAVPGHWEGDLLAGSRNTHVATLVERSSRFVRLVRVGGKDTESVVTALGEQARRLPKTMMATLTWDRGPETVPTPPTSATEANAEALAATDTTHPYRLDLSSPAYDRLRNATLQGQRGSPHDVLDTTREGWHPRSATFGRSEARSTKNCIMYLVCGEVSHDNA
jgi:IS30 family transposase